MPESATPTAASDKAGNVVWAAYYDPFGQASIITPAATASAPTISSNLRLAGQYWDAESGLHYNWHRYYEPGVGRYITADPIGLEAGVNLFAYVEANPLGFIDPQGLVPGDKNFGIKDPGFWKWWERNKYDWGPFNGLDGFNPKKPFDIPNKETADILKTEYDACNIRDAGRSGKVRSRGPRIKLPPARGGRGIE